MSTSQPQVILLSDPNGAGKSTAAPRLLKGALAVTEFVNADTVARGLSAFEPDRAAIQAGRAMLARIRELARQRTNFAFEITLAGRSFAPWIQDLIDDGYVFHLLYLWLPRPELAVARVAQRVRNGGHDVQPETIRRRYHAGLVNFRNLYQPLSCTWRVYDASPLSGPRLAAWGRGKETVSVLNSTIWNQVVAGR